MKGFYVGVYKEKDAAIERAERLKRRKYEVNGPIECEDGSIQLNTLDDNPSLFGKRWVVTAIFSQGEKE